ncbi:MAG: Gfo/Idh/MocA family oxidoreductase [Oligoflexia bacterium]|nr:Gfo/Idh/MocA family oxidoreductase [Oligoflexia bacterium]
MKVAILGCGLIGERRGLQIAPHEIVGVYDPDAERANSLAKKLNTRTFQNEEDLLKNSRCDIVIIATQNNQLAPLALKAIEALKHVLVEKPAAIQVNELVALKEAAKKSKVAVKVGFNHRFHPALMKAKELCDEGALGELMFLRGRYGHGGRLGYENEWRSNAKISGGGELIDQGVHLLDLIYYFLGPLPHHTSMVTTSYWPIKVDDNAVLTLSDGKKWATFHVSCSEWKNTFSLEIYGRTGKILIGGLGKSYGKETLTYYRMLPEMGPPESKTFEFDSEDRSWSHDLENLVNHITSGSPLLGDLDSALYALKQVREAYRANGFLNLPCSV